jgi:hypothetical protein
MWFETRQKRKKVATSSRPLQPVQPISPPPPYAIHTAQHGSYGGYGPVVPAPYLPPRAPSYPIYQHPQHATTTLTLPTNTSCPLVNATAGCYNKTVGLYDAVADKFCDVISQIDEDEFGGGVGDLCVRLPNIDTHDGYSADRRLVHFQKPVSEKKSKEKSVEVFSKLDLYLNSTLPASLPPLQLYIPTYPILCLAAEYAATAYRQPASSAEKKYFVSADGRTGTKAMVVKSVPCDDRRTIVFAIRGTSVLSLRDWGINLKTDPVTPRGFLDDEGNLCHAGFLKVAKAMVRPIAARLRDILQENPDRAHCSLLITGHSAGGAVASLLLAHMLSSTVHSELNTLTNCFKRVHCVTFGAPPISLLPLQKPNSADSRIRKCLFHSFMNEGDPVVRAEPAYVRSLVDLLAAPNSSANGQVTSQSQTMKPMASLATLGASMSRLDLSLKPMKSKQNLKKAHKQKLWWDVPPSTLSNAGRLVVLRVPKGMNEAQGIGAYVVSDEDLRRVIFGDPIMHQMAVYRRRIEALAFRAVTGKLCS